MAVTVASPPEQGQLVSVRSRQWIVTDVRPSTLPAPALKPTFSGPQHLLTLASVEDDGLGEELQVIWEIEPGAKVIEKVALPEPTGFDPPDKLDAFLDAVRWGAASTADVKNIQAPFRSGIDIEDYQLDPVVRAIQMPRVNLLIADDVGLGKTIEAGMTALELIIRHRARRILVVCPSALQIQWKEQMRDKFGLDFRIVDSTLMKELRRSRGIHVNPWSHFPRLITSIDFLKRERPLRLFREILPGPGEPTYPRKFDLLIVDEAHNCAPSGRGKYAIDSLRTQALRVLVPHFEHKLFLTATPHNGYPESFTALLELLDNQRFARGIPPDRKQLETVMVRRLKSELPPKWDGSPRFPKRVLEPLEVAYTQEERAIHAALRKYAELRQARCDDNAEKFATEFVLKTLKKRLFSSPAAFAATLEQHEKSISHRGPRGHRKKNNCSILSVSSVSSVADLQRLIDRIEEDYAHDADYDEATTDAVDTASRLFSEPTEEQHEKSISHRGPRGHRKKNNCSILSVSSVSSVADLQRLIDRIEEDYAHDADYDEATTDAVDTASRLFSEPTEEELALLKQMKEWAGRAAAQLDSKAKELIHWLNDHLRPGGKWGTERVIIFTEYRATQNWLETVLATEGFTGGDRLLTMYGGMDPHNREAVKAAFQTAPDISPVRILLATDAASEGLDLQNHCSRLIHYEIPWNPNRMEQRNGRIDRHGQKAAQVHIYHFVAQGYKDRERHNFSESVSDLEADLEFLMRVARKIETIREDLGKVGPVIALQVEEAMLGRRTTLNTAQAEREAEPVRRMLKFERDLAKQIKALMEQYHETQKELRLSPDNIHKVVEVALELAGQPPLVPITLPDQRTAYQLPGLKGSWLACSEGLTHPHTQKVRPITFDHTAARGRDDVVLVHLNHRLAQMSLRLLRAEVWNTGQRQGLKRITARIVPDHLLPTPAIIAHARLVVIGGDSQRLHEEVITAGGFIKEGKFSRMKVGEIEDALAAATDKEPSAKVKDTLLDLYPKLTPALVQALQTRTQDRTAGLQKKLAERANKEVNDIRAILTELKRAIEKELDDPEYAQPTLFDTQEEWSQYERNKLALQARIEEIPGEIERETAAIRARYADPQPRMFPVAVTFLVPERLT